MTQIDGVKQEGKHEVVGERPTQDSSFFLAAILSYVAVMNGESAVTLADAAQLNLQSSDSEALGAEYQELPEQFGQVNPIGGNPIALALQLNEVLAQVQVLDNKGTILNTNMQEESNGINLATAQMNAGIKAADNVITLYQRSGQATAM